tara:strand:- start:1076 stop:1576 length:501 start_codon:yes stop_codon:yes gene_type:complete
MSDAATEFPALDSDALGRVLTMLDYSSQCRLASVSSLWRSAVDTGSQIEHLNLTRYSQALTDETVARVARRCRNLRTINLAGAGAVTSAGVSSLKECRKLEEINLSCGPSVSADALEALCQALPALQSLELGGCLGSTCRGEEVVRRFGRYLDLEDDEDGLNQVQG